MIKKEIGRAFCEAASRYDRLTELQRQVGQNQLSRLVEMKRSFSTIVDVGSGTGFCTRKLAEQFPVASLLALDLAPGMIRAAKAQLKARPLVGYCVGDAENLPIKSDSVGLVFSNLMLQWCEQTDRLFSEFYRVLEKDGVALFSSFGPDTLCELKAAWEKADGFQHVNEFCTTEKLELAMKRAGFCHYEIERVTVKRYYQDVFELMRELKGIGASTITSGRVNHLTGKGQMAKMSATYNLLKEPEGLPATWEVVYGFARK